MKWQTIYEVVTKLNGGIEPIGDSAYDKKAFDNMETLMDLADELIEDICVVAKYATRPEASMAKAGKSALEWLQQEIEYMGNTDERLEHVYRRYRREID